MDLHLHDKIRKQIGANLKKAIEASTKDKPLRKIDSLTGKDYSWIAKVYKGKMNITIDSIITLALSYRLDFKDIFKIDAEYSNVTDQEMWDYLISKRKKKRTGQNLKKKL